MPLFTRRRLFAGFAAFGAVVGVLGLRSASARYYDGPVSDHFDGTRFFDPHSSPRSEEHTSELQSRSDLVCRLLLEKKKSVGIQRYAGRESYPAATPVCKEHDELS